MATDKSVTDRQGGADRGSRYSAPAAGCAARVLLTLARARTPLSLADLARETGCSKSLTFRVIRELEAVNLVSSPGGQGYRLSHGVLEFSAAVARLGESEELRDVMRELSIETGQTVNLGVLRGFDVLITAKQQPAQALVSVTYVGARLPANCSALGKVLLAGLSQDDVRAALPAELPALTSKSTIEPVALLAELETVRKAGYAVDFESAILGRFAMAVPVTMPEDVNAALAVTGSMDDYSDEHHRLLYRALSLSAQRIERAAANAEAS